MASHIEVHTITSVEKTDFVDVTDLVSLVVSRSGMRQGIVNVFPMHTTTTVRINENEPRLIRDLRNFLDCLVPCSAEYKHDDIHKRPVPEDEKINAHSHLKSFILGTGESLPFQEGKPVLGTWQSIFFIDFDGPQQRKIRVSVVGE